MTTSSSEAPRDGSAKVVRHRLPAGAHGVLSALPVRVHDRTPPPPPPPPVDLRPLARAVDEAAAQIRAQLEPVFHEIEMECVDLVLAATESILRKEIDRGNYDLAGPIHELVERHRRLLAAGDVQLFVHPGDYEVLQEPAGAEALPFQLRLDPALEPGSLRFETGATMIVRSLLEELQRLRRSFGEQGGEP